MLKENCSTYAPHTISCLAVEKLQLSNVGEYLKIDCKKKLWEQPKKCFLNIYHNKNIYLNQTFTTCLNYNFISIIIFGRVLSNLCFSDVIHF